MPRNAMAHKTSQVSFSFGHGRRHLPYINIISSIIILDLDPLLPVIRIHIITVIIPPQSINIVSPAKLTHSNQTRMMDQLAR